MACVDDRPCELPDRRRRQELTGPCFGAKPSSDIHSGAHEAAVVCDSLPSMYPNANGDRSASVRRGLTSRQKRQTAPYCGARRGQDDVKAVALGLDLRAAVF
jgi:hypothetical protein